MSNSDSHQERISFIVSYMDLLRKEERSNEDKGPDRKTVVLSPSKEEADELAKWLEDRIVLSDYLNADVEIKGHLIDEIGISRYQTLLSKISSCKNNIELPDMDIFREQIENYRKVHNPNQKSNQECSYDRLKSLGDYKEVKLNKAKAKLLEFFYDATGKSIIKSILTKTAELVNQRDIAKHLNGIKKFVDYNGKPFNFNRVNTLYSSTTSFIDDFVDRTNYIEDLQDLRRGLSNGSAYLQISIEDNSLHTKNLDESDAKLLARETKDIKSHVKELPLDVEVKNESLVIQLHEGEVLDKRLLLRLYNLNGEPVFAKNILFTTSDNGEISISFLEDAKLFPGGYIFLLADEDCIHFKKEFFGESFLNKNVYLPMYEKFSIGKDLYDLGPSYEWRKILFKGKPGYKPVQEVEIGI